MNLPGGKLHHSEEFGGSIRLSEYAEEIEATDRLPEDNLQPVLMGLFGEVGSLMTTVKKWHRERSAYAGYRLAVEEEFGDALWYFVTLCRRLGIGVDVILSRVVDQAGYGKSIAATDLADSPMSEVCSIDDVAPLDSVLLKLGEAAAALLGVRQLDDDAQRLLCSFGDSYLRALHAANVSFARIARVNIDKVRGRFLDRDLTELPTFDSEFPDEERLPDYFEIHIVQRQNGKGYLKWNGVFIGDPLTDNIMEKDAYRFHDVFHLTHAAVLHWSPTFRALIKHKRKSKKSFDENQDGGRAIAVEEGLTAWVFSCAKELDFFRGKNSVSFDLLKTVQQFVKGYEVESCPLRLWELAILKGFEMFRCVRDNDGGILIGDRNLRNIEYRNPVCGSGK